MKKNNYQKYNADYPARKKAIEILRLIEEKCVIDLCGLFYYELEDMITEIINDKTTSRKDLSDLRKTIKEIVEHGDASKITSSVMKEFKRYLNEKNTKTPQKPS